MVELYVTYDGHPLNNLFIIEQVDRKAIAPIDLETASVAGRDGEMWLSSRRGMNEVTITMTAIGYEYSDVLASIRKFAGWLVVDEPKKLMISDEDGLWRMAAPSGDIGIERIGQTAARVSVTFVVPDACMHGEGIPAVASGNTATILIDGTLPAPIKVDSASASGDFTLLDSVTGKTMVVEIGSTAQSLSIDCDKRTCKVGGNTRMITLTSDWLVLDPGWHTITRTGGSGSFTVSYESRWA